LLTTFLGGTRQPELALLDEREISSRVQAEHAALLGAAGSPELARVTRWHRAIPQYALGHAKRIACVEEAERDFHGLFFCANYRGGVAIGDCIKSADRAVEQVAAFLRAG
jgi:protoporphyrinogen/coproporphyrinogen III oxidase